MKFTPCSFQRKCRFPSVLLFAFSVASLLLCGRVEAVEYFVNLKGSDSADGKTAATAFASIQKGVDSLAPGDTLTVAPGEYFGSVFRNGLGSMDAETTIRAAIPGTVVMRGDVPAPKFEKMENRRHVYVADFSGDVQAVNEADTWTLLKDAPSVDEVEFSPGTSSYDRKEKKLYISTSDMRPAEQHFYTVSVVPQHGLYLEYPKRVVVDGLVFRGFNNIGPLKDYRPQFVTWGLFFPGAVNCAVRNSTAFLNGGGIVIATLDGEGNLIEDCVGYGNGSPHNSEGGNVSVFSSNNDTIRRCVGYRSVNTGVRIYGLGKGPGTIDQSLGWGNGGPDVGLKGNDLGDAKNSIALRNLAGKHFSHNIVGEKLVNIEETNLAKDNVFLAAEKIPPGREFVDPVNFDFRLQSTSKLRGSAPDGSDRGPFQFKSDVFFVRPDGDDAGDGLSLKTAWKTGTRAVQSLKPGDTVYFEEGVYAGPLVVKAGQAEGKPITLKGRGTARVIFPDSVSIDSSAGVAFERLNFSKTVQVKKTTGVAFENCRFGASDKGVEAEEVSGLRIAHSEFTGSPKTGLALQDCQDVVLTSNLFDNAGGVAVQVGGGETSLLNGLVGGVKSLLGTKAPAPKFDSIVSHSDYNAYSNPAKAWALEDRVVPLSELQETQDRHSISQPFKFVDQSGIRVLADRHPFEGRGALGKGIGFHQELAGYKLFMSEPVVHSVSATTANIEWLVSRGAECEVAWGETPQCENTLNFTINTFQDLFRTFSLTGLKPGTKYYFRVKSIKMPAYPDLGATDVVDPHYDVISFTTAASDPAPRTLYVAPDGSDQNSGIERAQAWKTVSHAAATAAPGDTVLIAAGTYIEKVRVRTTGDTDKPITFKSMPGERVIFDGNDRRLNNAWTINGKTNIVVDGFYFYNHQGEPGGNISTRLFDVVQSRDILIRRCFMNGLGGRAYPASFLTGWTTQNLTISNCVSILAPDGVDVSLCPDFRIENSVFILTMISNVKLSTPATLANNIFCDSGEFKSLAKVHLQLYNTPGAVQDRNNCYYFRLPDEERVAFVLKWPEKISLAELKKRQPETDSIIADPQFAIMATLPEKRRKPFTVDALYEDGGKLDFPDLFATNSEVVARGIGLQPAAFSDFHFHNSQPPNP